MDRKSVVSTAEPSRFAGLGVPEDDVRALPNEVDIFFECKRCKMSRCTKKIN